ncbi:unannotated protein [freshwater metagenome]|uniref:Unannotated protein n=1 Tax=freshwater metagenome TaxID=449393 RepID=A0A6J6MSH7_9ZZZZ
MRLRIISEPLTASKPFMHAANAPTPGTTKPSASMASSKSDVRMTLSLAVANARCAERRLPDP